MKYEELSTWRAPTTLAELESALDRSGIFVHMGGGRWWVARRNGQTKTWKTRPTEFRVPIKMGLKGAGQITHLWAFDSDHVRMRP